MRGALRRIRSLWVRKARQARRACYVALEPALTWQMPGSMGAGADLGIRGGGRIALGPGVDLADGARLFAKEGLLEIGARSFVGIGALIVARDAIRIGQDVLIAEYVTIRDQDHDMAGGFLTAPIHIEDGVWLGAKATVTRGVRIGSRSVIGANAVVTEDIPPDVVAAGVPARVLRERCP